MAFVIDQIEGFAEKKHPLGPVVSTENVGVSGLHTAAGEAKPPKLFLTLEEADHFRPHIYRDSSQEGLPGLTTEASILFLDWSLKGKGEAPEQLTAVVEQNRNLGSLEIRP